MKTKGMICTGCGNVMSEVMHDNTRAERLDIAKHFMHSILENYDCSEDYPRAAKESLRAADALIKELDIREGIK